MNKIANYVTHSCVIGPIDSVVNILKQKP